MWIREEVEQRQVSPNRPEPQDPLSTVKTWKRTDYTTHQRPNSSSPFTQVEENIKGERDMDNMHTGEPERQEERLNQDRDLKKTIWIEALTARGQKEIPGWPMVQQRDT